MTMKNNTLYISTKSYPKAIAFVDTIGTTQVLSLNNDTHWCKDVSIELCNNSDHRPYQRAEYALSVAINAYKDKVGEMPKNIHFNWEGMETSPPTSKDIQIAITSLKLQGTNFLGIYNSPKLSSVSMFAMATAIAVPTIAYLYSHYSQENSHS